jgi:hypothetical protein
MFIRKRTQKLKNGHLSETFQAVESYRLGGKVKQHVVNLGANPNPKEVLREELKFMKKALEYYNFPLSNWTELKCSPANQPCRIKLAETQAMIKRDFWRKIYEGHKQRVGKLESVVSKYPTLKYTEDTTFKEGEDKKKEAEDNLKEIEKIIGS